MKNELKKFKVADNCIACGSCMSLTTCLEESDEGKAIAKGYIVNLNEKQIEEILAICPVHALSVSVDSGQEAKKLIQELKNFKFPKITWDEFKFDEKEYRLDLPTQILSMQYKYNYSSYNKAKQAAFDALDKAFYSKRENHMIKVMAEYKAQKLRKYYLYENAPGNYYNETIKSLEQILKKIATLAEATGKKLPSDLVKIKAMPTVNDDKYEAFSLKIFETGYASRAMTEFTWKISDYYNFDIDDQEHYVGTGLFGNDKYDTRYCILDLDKSLYELRDDIISACGYAICASDIQEMVEGAVQPWKEKLEKEIAEKVELAQEVLLK